MANDGSDDRKKTNPEAGPKEDRPKPRRRRRGRKSGDRANQGADAQGKAAPEGKETKEGQPAGKSRGRRRGRSRKDKGEPRSQQQPRAERAQTIPPPKGESLPPAAASEGAKPKEKKPRRGKRDEAARSRRGKQARGRAREPKAAEPRWSQAPPPAAREPDAVPEPKPSERPRRDGPPVFLPPPQADAALDEDTLIDRTPWEVDVDEGDGEGSLYNTVLVRSNRSNRARMYDAGDSTFTKGEVVAIEGDSGGPGTGVVVQHNRRALVRGRLPRVTRRVHPNEVSPEPRGKRREQEVYRIARHVASTLDLPIKIVRAQAEPSGKIVVFFASEERIDFRELYRRVSAAAQGRVELRQVGVRDAAKLLGGVAPCGLQLCCTSFLRDFAPVSIKMAKEQGLVLNPQRVSGLCGRLLCCLTYEDELYRKQRKLLPKLGKRVVTPRGPGKVRDVDVLSQSVRVALESGEVVTVEPADITPMFPSQRQGGESDGEARRQRADSGDGKPEGRGRRRSGGRKRQQDDATGSGDTPDTRTDPERGPETNTPQGRSDT